MTSKLEQKLENYSNLFDYVKENLSDYHYDLDRDDNLENDLVFQQKFVGDWENELEHFEEIRRMDFNLDIPATKKQMQHWLSIGYGPANFGGKSKINPDTMPTLQKIVDSIEFENKQAWLTKQVPGEWVPYHHDVLSSAGVSLEECIERGQRILVILTPWSPGQFIQYGNKVFSQWKPGFIITWPAHKYPHATANSSFNPRYTLRISGLRTPEFEEKFLNNRDVIVID